MALVIAAAEPGQFEDILSFWLQATEVASSTDDHLGLTTLHAHDPEALFVATEDGQLVGTLITGWDGWRANFYRLAVRPTNRGQGIGRALVAAGEARFRRLGARRVVLFAVESHDPAVSFWRAVGYEQDQDDVRFTRNLPAAP
jgi:ribosomal protein S18 acetylase RimI-like enzyme